MTMKLQGIEDDKLAATRILNILHTTASARQWNELVAALAARRIDVMADAYAITCGEHLCGFGDKNRPREDEVYDDAITDSAKAIARNMSVAGAERDKLLHETKQLVEQSVNEETRRSARGYVNSWFLFMPFLWLCVFVFVGMLLYPTGRMDITCRCLAAFFAVFALIVNIVGIKAVHTCQKAGIDL